ncbi:MAG: hypothetical protein M1835_001617, partial [Candelina submexicana]
MSTLRARAQSQQTPPASPLLNLRPRADSDSLQTSLHTADAAPSLVFNQGYLPFVFGTEFELIMRPKWIPVPDFDASVRKFRDFNLALLRYIADLLSQAGMPAATFDPSEDDKPDYSKWNVMLDGSLSKKHMVDGF